MTLKIRKILISQPEPTTTDKSPFMELAKNNNIKIDFRPFIHVEGVTAKEFRKSRINILEHTAVLFTSKTAVDHFFRMTKEMKLLVPDTYKYFCVSESIAFYLQHFITYRKRKVFYGKGTFDDIFDLLVKHKDERYVIPVSDVHKPEIPQKLDKHKLRYSMAVLYQTVCSDLSDLAKDEYDMLVFYSPSGVKALLQNFPDFEQNKIKIGSFGASTAKAVREAGLRLDIEAPRPEAPSMTMAIEQFIQQQNKRL